MESNSTGFLPSECYNKTQYHRLCTQWMYWWNPIAQASYTVNVIAKFSTTSLRSKRICVVSDFSHGQNRKSRFSVFLCSETTRKRLLRRLQWHRLCTRWKYWWNPVQQISYTVEVLMELCSTWHRLPTLLIFMTKLSGTGMQIMKEGTETSSNSQVSSSEHRQS